MTGWIVGQKLRMADILSVLQDPLSAAQPASLGQGEPYTNSARENPPVSACRTTFEMTWRRSEGRPPLGDWDESGVQEAYQRWIRRVLDPKNSWLKHVEPGCRHHDIAPNMAS